VWWYGAKKSPDLPAVFFFQNSKKFKFRAERYTADTLAHFFPQDQEPTTNVNLQQQATKPTKTNTEII
jgi:hypothetical protein